MLFLICLTLLCMIPSLLFEFLLFNCLKCMGTKIVVLNFDLPSMMLYNVPGLDISGI